MKSPGSHLAQRGNGPAHFLEVTERDEDFLRRRVKCPVITVYSW